MFILELISRNTNLLILYRVLKDILYYVVKINTKRNMVTYYLNIVILISCYYIGFHRRLRSSCWWSCRTVAPRQPFDWPSIWPPGDMVQNISCGSAGTSDSLAYQRKFSRPNGCHPKVLPPPTNLRCCHL